MTLRPAGSPTADGTLFPVPIDEGDLPVRLETLDASCAFSVAGAGDLIA